MAITAPPSGLGHGFVLHPDAIARLPRALAFRHDALPLHLADGVLTVALADPHDRATVDALRAATRLTIRALPMTRATLRDQLHVAYGDAPAALAQHRVDDAPAVVAVDLVLARAIAAHASDVHIEPVPDGGVVRLRVDGIMRDLERIPAALFPAFTSRLKLLASMDIADRRQPQDGRCSVPFETRTIDARVSSMPSLDGEKLVVRLLDHHAATPDLAQLGMPSDLYERYRAAAAAPWGFVVVTGPTGSGKTTTLYASLAQLDVRSRNICSVEDPIEMRLAGVTQVQVHPRAGLTFPAVLRAFLRQDPDVIMVGEMRDAETAAVAVSAALAGQIVFTTLHANDAPRSIDRLVELGVARHTLAAALTAVVSQRLVRTLCEQCRREDAIPPPLRAALRTERRTWFRAVGCRACSGTGYVGRTGMYELLVLDDAQRDAIATGASSVHVAQLAARGTYRPIVEDAVAKVLDGTTTFDELRRVVTWNAPA